MTKFLNISTDNTLGGNTPSDVLVASQKAIKEYVDSQSGGGSVDIDNSTITTNTSDEIQAVAVIDQNTGIAKTWTGTMAEYEAIVTKDPETEYIITDDIGGSATEFRKEVSERNIGEIVYSTIPITDSGLHLADGEVLDGAGIYKDFYDYMVAKSASAPEIFTTEANWQAEVTANGVCGKYVLDTSLVSIRLPKLKNKLLSDNAVVGNGMTLGFTNGTSNAGLYCSSGTTNVQIGKNMYGQPVGYSAGGTNLTELASFGVTADPTKSGIKVASSVDVYYYVVIANTAKVPVQVDIDNITTELNACYAHRVVAFQAPTAANNYTWYRKYADGWVEQGGIYNTSALTYLIPMADTNYIMFLQPMNTSGNYAMRCQNLTTTGASIQTAASSWHNYSWQVSGMAA